VKSINEEGAGSDDIGGRVKEASVKVE